MAILDSSGLPAAPIGKKADRQAFVISSRFSVQTGRSTVSIQVGEQTLELMPEEARLLAQKLFMESEAAIGNAICLRIMLELGSMSVQEAVQVLQAVSQGTRGDHMAAYQRAREQAAEAQAQHEEQEAFKQSETPEQKM